MLFRCCLIHITIIIPGHILCLVYLCSCLCLGLFMSYLCDLFFVFSLIFIVINHTSSLKETYLFLAHFQNVSYYFWMITWMKKVNNFQKLKVQPKDVAQLLLDFLPILAWRCLKKCCLYKSVLSCLIEGGVGIGGGTSIRHQRVPHLIHLFFILVNLYSGEK